MKILHVWNQSSSSCVMAKWQRKKGHQAHVIAQAKHDSFNCAKNYKEEVVSGGRIKFVLTTLKRCKNYDIIHLHDAWFMVHLIKIFYPKKKIIMEYHGSLIRLGMKETRRKLWEKHVDKILVSTPDLLDYNYIMKPIYIPNPVDTEVFYPISRKNNGMCVIILKKKQSEYKVNHLLVEHGINVKLDKPLVVLHTDFPDLLKEYEYCCDVPMANHKIIPANSTVGLQAMAMGIKTIQYDFSIKDSLPEEHYPENVVKKLDEVYNA